MGKGEAGVGKPPRTYANHGSSQHFLPTTSVTATSSSTSDYSPASDFELGSGIGLGAGAKGSGSGCRENECLCVFGAGEARELVVVEIREA